MLVSLITEGSEQDELKTDPMLADACASHNHTYIHGLMMQRMPKETSPWLSETRTEREMISTKGKLDQVEGSIV